MGILYKWWIWKNPIQNNDLRKALFYGIDRDKISKGVFKVYESTPYYISSPVVDYKMVKISWYRRSKAIRPEGSGFDPELARIFWKSLKPMEIRKLK